MPSQPGAAAGDPTAALFASVTHEYLVQGRIGSLPTETQRFRARQLTSQATAAEMPAPSLVFAPAFAGGKALRVVGR